MKKSTGLDAYFERASLEEPRRTLARSFGEVGSGKTAFWLSATSPVLVQSFDKGVEGLMRQLLTRLGLTEKTVYVRHYKWAPGREDFDQAYAQTIRARFEEDFRRFLEGVGGHRGTVVWDKETDIWQCFRYAEFGAPNTRTRTDYAALYARYAALIDDLKDTNLSFGAIQAMADEWGPYTNPNTGVTSRQTTGRRIPAGCDRLDEMVLTDIFHERRLVTHEGPEKQFSMTLGKVRQNGCMQDQTFENLTFAEFGQLLLPESEAEEW